MNQFLIIIGVIVAVVIGFFLARRPDCPSFRPAEAAPAGLFDLTFPDYNCQTVKLPEIREKIKNLLAL